MTNTYDAIVVGARCGGAATARLLARKGHKVLVVDRATFPSDTLSSHFVHLRGAAALGRWGLLEAVAKATPAVERYSIDFGLFRVAGAPRPAPGGITTAYAPRRPTLDTILVDAACGAGAEVREGVTVQDVVWENGRVVGVRGRTAEGTTFVEKARIVIGADGRSSRIAKAVGAEELHGRPTFAASYYAYWSGVQVDGLEVYVRPARSYGAFPTEDSLTLVVMSWPIAEFKANRDDVEGNVMKALEMAPSLHERVAAGTRETRFRGTGDVPGYYRHSFGPGWALVGDARHHKDPCTAQGISDAFADAERLTEALDEVWSGAQTETDALRRYHHDGHRADAPHVRLHLPAGLTRASAAGDGGAAPDGGRRLRGQPRLRQRPRRHEHTARVPLARQHRGHHGPGGDAACSGLITRPPTLVSEPCMRYRRTKAFSSAGEPDGSPAAGELLRSDRDEGRGPRSMLWARPGPSARLPSPARSSSTLSFPSTR